MCNWKLLGWMWCCSKGGGHRKLWIHPPKNHYNHYTCFNANPAKTQCFGPVCWTDWIRTMTDLSLVPGKNGLAYPIIFSYSIQFVSCHLLHWCICLLCCEGTKDQTELCVCDWQPVSTEIKKQTQYLVLECKFVLVCFPHRSSLYDPCQLNMTVLAVSSF